MAKIVVTHFSPDLDAIAAVWLVKRFLPGWEKAEVKFTPPGEYTIDNKPVDSDPDVLYVDTGRGKFDHHQTNKFICSATLVWEHTKKETGKKDEAIERLIEVVNQVDHARDLTWPQADNDRYLMMFHLVLEGVKRTAQDNPNREILDFGFRALDGVLKMFQERVAAEKELKKGKKFKTRWGKAIALETKNDSVLFLGEKQGYCLVVQLIPDSNHLKIFGRWDKGIDLTKAWKEIKRRDPETFWFLHGSKTILSNGARNQPGYKPTKLTIEEIIKILKKS